MTVPIVDRRGIRNPDVVTGVLAIPASWLYGVGARLMKILYDSGILRARRVPLPVVSIGALSVGGSGKTPFVIWLASRLQEHGVPLAILSRGYGGTGGAAPRVVDPEHPDAARDGDEPVLIARMLPDIPVIVSPDRARGAALADGRGARILLLDDGFQHRKLHRDLDVVLWDAASAASKGRLIPAGRLREPLSALRRADLVVLVDRGGGPPAPPDMDVDATMDARLFPVARQRLLEGTRVHALSGIGDPVSFERGLESLGLTLTGSTRYADHHTFRGSEIRDVRDRANDEGADVIAVTAKDWVRWPAKSKDLPVPAVFDLAAEVDAGDALVGRIAGLARERTAS